MRKKTRKPNRQKAKLGLPDLEHVKSAVLVSLRSPESQRSYRRSIDDFVCWYCSEPRLSFNKTVVTRYRIHLEDRLLAPGTINVRLAAVRRLAYEAADTGLLSPDLAAGIRRVKGVKKLGMRLGNWLTVEEARALWQLPNIFSVKGKRGYDAYFESDEPPGLKTWGSKEQVRSPSGTALPPRLILERDYRLALIGVRARAVPH